MEPKSTKTTDAKIKRNKKNLLIALERSLGIVTSACKECNISRTIFYRYYNTDDVFKEAVNSLDDVTIDFVENQLLKAIKDQNVAAITFYMKYKGKKRGYIDSSEVDVNHHVIKAPKKRND